MGGPYPSQVKEVIKEVNVEYQEITFYIITFPEAGAKETINRRSP
jgi:hypothetical protein